MSNRAKSRKPSARRLGTAGSSFTAFVLIVCVFSSGGCALRQWAHQDFKVGPDYCRPSASVADQWIDNREQNLIYDRQSDVQWWSSLNDPALDQLVELAYSQNLTLREAGWRVSQARAIRAIAVGNLFPQAQQGFGQYTRVLDSQNIALPAPLRAFSDWQVGASLAWELDVWGRYRRSIASADANLQATVGDYDAILLSLIAEVATAYTNYCTAELQLTYAQRNIEIQESSLALTRKKAELGATGFTGVYLAESSLEATRAGIPQIEVSKRQASNQLCTLLGLPPQDIQSLLGDGDLPETPTQAVVGIPANLLRRRPDIRAAERAVAAQSEQIGIAMVDLYPSYTITGDFALQSERFADLFQSGSDSGAIGPGFQWNLLNYGRIRNNVRLQRAAFQELVTAYRNAVLTANREVEDAMIAFLKSQETYQRLQKSVVATEEALKLLTISFDEGEIDFSPVFLLQGELVQAQNQLALSQGAVITSLIALYKALGGGWEVRCSGFQTGLAMISEDEFDALVPGPEFDDATTEELPVPREDISGEDDELSDLLLQGH